MWRPGPRGQARARIPAHGSRGGRKVWPNCALLWTSNRWPWLRRFEVGAGGRPCGSRPKCCAEYRNVREVLDSPLSYWPPKPAKKHPRGSSARGCSTLLHRRVSREGRPDDVLIGRTHVRNGCQAHSVAVRQATGTATVDVVWSHDLVHSSSPPLSHPSSPDRRPSQSRSSPGEATCPSRSRRPDRTREGGS